MRWIISIYGMDMPMDFNATATVKVVQKKNDAVAPVTFEFEVVENHYDHVIVNVTPSDLNATYVLGVEQQMGFDEAYKGNWVDYAASQVYGEQFTGVVTNQRLDINRYGDDDEDPATWKYWVYAFTVDAEKSAVSGEVSKLLVNVKNDRPAIVCPEGFTQDGTTFTLDVYGKGGEYKVKLEAENVKEGEYGFKLYDSNTWQRVDEAVVEDSAINHAVAVLGNDQKVSVKDGYLAFTVNDYPADWSADFNPFVTFNLYLTDGENTKVHNNYSVKIRLYPAE